MTPTAERAIARLLERLRTEAPHTHPEVAAIIAGKLRCLPGKSMCIDCRKIFDTPMVPTHGCAMPRTHP